MNLINWFTIGYVRLFKNVNPSFIETGVRDQVESGSIDRIFSYLLANKTTYVGFDSPNEVYLITWKKIFFTV